MKCPQCNGTASGVVESRKRVDHVWRQRRCYGCEHRYDTIEILRETYLRLMEAVRENSTR